MNELIEVWIKDHNLHELKEDQITDFMVHEYAAFMADQASDDYTHLCSTLDTTDYLSCYSRAYKPHSSLPRIYFDEDYNNQKKDEELGLKQLQEDYIKVFKEDLIDKIDTINTPIDDPNYHGMTAKDFIEPELLK